jgi:transcriptional regulator with XRE-family HTH domain
MARNFKELQAKMDPASRAGNKELVKEELQRMALEELRSARQLTQTDLAEMLNVPQSSISRIERRADMYLSTLRNYVQAMGGVLQIQAVFPDSGAVVINRFGDYEDRMYRVFARRESGGVYRLFARPFQHPGSELSTKAFKLPGLVKTMKALDLAEPQISGIRTNLDNGDLVEIGGHAASRIFSAPDLAAAGFEIPEADSEDGRV